MMPTLRLAACLALAAFVLPASAQQPVSVKGDAAAGELKVYTCTGCHGIPGYKNIYPHYHVPKIVGQNYDYIVAALTEYQKGERSHPTMRAQAESFTAQDIADIAAYLSTHKVGDHK
ncbi:cytochrome c553 [Chiayiivirga flava]|uniref:Cytochrome c553 n=2 Tax=Chiayiivirga flava TaxID=659595 RepID=A0A7W8D628_9GAMM|nr:cytochrome c553 [Chiayiivirga flava]